MFVLFWRYLKAKKGENHSNWRPHVKCACAKYVCIPGVEWGVQFTNSATQLIDIYFKLVLSLLGRIIALWRHWGIVCDVNAELKSEVDSVAVLITDQFFFKTIFMKELLVMPTGIESFKLIELMVWWQCRELKIASHRGRKMLDSNQEVDRNKMSEVIIFKSYLHCGSNIDFKRMRLMKQMSILLLYSRRRVWRRTVADRPPIFRSLQEWNFFSFIWSFFRHENCEEMKGKNLEWVTM